MNSTEEYLDKLLESVTSGELIPEPEEPEFDSVNPDFAGFGQNLFAESAQMEEPVIEEPVIEDSETEEFETAEPETSDSITDGLFLDDLPLDDSAKEEQSFDELSLDDLPLKELSEDTEMEASSDEDSLLEDEDISNLLKSIEEMGSPADEAADEEEGQDNFENELSDLDFEEQEEPGTEAAEEIDEVSDIDEISDIDDVNDIEDNAPKDDDADLAELLAGMSDDEELSEINDLLNKNDNNEIVDTEETPERELSEDELFDIEEPLADEDEDEEADGKNAGKKKKGKKVKKEKKAKKEKKPGFFSKLFSSLTEEAEEPEDVKQIFAEETALDIAQEGAADNEKILEEMGEEDSSKKKGKKGKKEKKEKKPKKEKKVKEKKEEEPGPPQKKLPKKKVILIGALCFSLGVMMTLLAFLYPYYTDMKNAQMEFEHQNYEQTYELLKGHRLNEEQKLMYDKSVVLLKSERKYDSYSNYMQLGMKVEALNALVQGIKITDELSETAAALDVQPEFEAIRTKIADELQNTFAVSLDKAYEWLQLEDGQAYSRALDSFINGDPTDKEPGNLVIQGEQPDNPVIAGEEEEFADDSND